MAHCSTEAVAWTDSQVALCVFMCLSDSCCELLLFVPRTFSARGRLVAGVSGQIPARCSVVVKSGEMSGETKIAALNEEPTRQETGAGVKSQDSRQPRQNGMRLVRLHCRSMAFS